MPFCPKSQRRFVRQNGQRSRRSLRRSERSERWFWGVVGAAFGAHDGYKYAKKKKYTGWKKAACIVGGAILGAVNPCKVFKAAKTGYKAYKASKYARKARSSYKKYKSVRKALKKPKVLKKAKKKVKKVRKPAKVKKSKKIVKKEAKQLKAPAKVRTSIKVGPYKIMSKKSSGVGQAHHLSQAAAFKEVIPYNEGMCVKLEGNAFKDVGSPHYNAHASLEQFWNKYRSKGELYGSNPTIGEYNKAVHESLISGGLSKPDAAYAVRQAYEQQKLFGLSNSDFVPNIPRRMGQKR